MAPGVEQQKLGSKVVTSTAAVVDPTSGKSAPVAEVPNHPVLKPNQFKDSAYLVRPDKSTPSNWGPGEKYTVSFNTGSGNEGARSDGDTLNVGPYKCRITGIDAPEREKSWATPPKPGQPYGEDALSHMKKLIANKEVTVQVSRNPSDKSYDRDLCQITFEGKNLSRELVAAGYAWVYREYVKKDMRNSLLQAEDSARGGKKGIWAGNPEYPEDFKNKK